MRQSTENEKCSSKIIGPLLGFESKANLYDSVGLIITSLVDLSRLFCRVGHESKPKKFVL